MIVGNGDIAAALREGGVDRYDLTFFASGVSNSRETRESEYSREADLLTLMPAANRLVYFSSLCIYYNNNTRYAQHKREMEWRIKLWFPRWTILRLGNITWGTNPHTLVNHLRAVVARGEAPDIRDVYRYLTDQDEFLDAVRQIPDKNCEMDFLGRRLKVADIYQEFVLEAIA